MGDSERRHPAPVGDGRIAFRSPLNQPSPLVRSTYDPSLQPSRPLLRQHAGEGISLSGLLDEAAIPQAGLTSHPDPGMNAGNMPENAESTGSVDWFEILSSCDTSGRGRLQYDDFCAAVRVARGQSMLFNTEHAIAKIWNAVAGDSSLSTPSVAEAADLLSVAESLQQPTQETDHNESEDDFQRLLQAHTSDQTQPVLEHSRIEDHLRDRREMDEYLGANLRQEMLVLNIRRRQTFEEETVEMAHGQTDTFESFPERGLTQRAGASVSPLHRSALETSTASESSQATRRHDSEPRRSMPTNFVGQLLLRHADRSGHVRNFGEIGGSLRNNDSSQSDMAGDGRSSRFADDQDVSCRQEEFEEHSFSDAYTQTLQNTRNTATQQSSQEVAHKQVGSDSPPTSGENTRTKAGNASPTESLCSFSNSPSMPSAPPRPMQMPVRPVLEPGVPAPTAATEDWWQRIADSADRENACVELEEQNTNRFAGAMRNVTSGSSGRISNEAERVGILESTSMDKRGVLRRLNRISRSNSPYRAHSPRIHFKPALSKVRREAWPDDRNSQQALRMERLMRALAHAQDDGHVAFSEVGRAAAALRAAAEGGRRAGRKSAEMLRYSLEDSPAALTPPDLMQVRPSNLPTLEDATRPRAQHAAIGIAECSTQVTTPVLAPRLPSHSPTRMEQSELASEGLSSSKTGTASPQSTPTTYSNKLANIMRSLDDAISHYPPPQLFFEDIPAVVAAVHHPPVHDAAATNLPSSNRVSIEMAQADVRASSQKSDSHQSPPAPITWPDTICPHLLGKGAHSHSSTQQANQQTHSAVARTRNSHPSQTLAGGGQESVPEIRGKVSMEQPAGGSEERTQRDNTLGEMAGSVGERGHAGGAGRSVDAGSPIRSPTRDLSGGRNVPQRRDVVEEGLLDTPKQHQAPKPAEIFHAAPTVFYDPSPVTAKRALVAAFAKADPEKSKIGRSTSSSGGGFTPTPQPREWVPARAHVVPTKQDQSALGRRTPNTVQRTLPLPGAQAQSMPGRSAESTVERRRSLPGVEALEEVVPYDTPTSANVSPSKTKFDFGKYGISQIRQAGKFLELELRDVVTQKHLLSSPAFWRAVVFQSIDLPLRLRQLQAMRNIMDATRQTQVGMVKDAHQQLMKAIRDHAEEANRLSQLREGAQTRARREKEALRRGKLAKQAAGQPYRPCLRNDTKNQPDDVVRKSIEVKAAHWNDDAGSGQMLMQNSEVRYNLLTDLMPKLRLKVYLLAFQAAAAMGRAEFIVTRFSCQRNRKVLLRWSMSVISSHVYRAKGFLEVADARAYANRVLYAKRIFAMWAALAQFRTKLYNLASRSIRYQKRILCANALYHWRCVTKAKEIVQLKWTGAFANHERLAKAHIFCEWHRFVGETRIKKIQLLSFSSAEPAPPLEELRESVDRSVERLRSSFREGHMSASARFRKALVGLGARFYDLSSKAPQNIECEIVHEGGPHSGISARSRDLPDSLPHSLPHQSSSPALLPALWVAPRGVGVSNVYGNSSDEDSAAQSARHLWKKRMRPEVSEPDLNHSPKHSRRSSAADIGEGGSIVPHWQNSCEASVSSHEGPSGAVSAGGSLLHGSSDDSDRIRKRADSDRRRTIENGAAGKDDLLTFSRHWQLIVRPEAEQPSSRPTQGPDTGAAKRNDGKSRDNVAAGKTDSKSPVPSSGSSNGKVSGTHAADADNNQVGESTTNNLVDDNDTSSRYSTDSRAAPHYMNSEAFNAMMWRKALTRGARGSWEEVTWRVRARRILQYCLRAWAKEQRDAALAAAFAERRVLELSHKWLAFLKQWSAAVMGVKSRVAENQHQRLSAAILRSWFALCNVQKHVARKKGHRISVAVLRSWFSICKATEVANTGLMRKMLRLWEDCVRRWSSEVVVFGEAARRTLLKKRIMARWFGGMFTQKREAENVQAVQDICRHNNLHRYLKCWRKYASHSAEQKEKVEHFHVTIIGSNSLRRFLEMWRKKVNTKMLLVRVFSRAQQLWEFEGSLERDFELLYTTLCEWKQMVAEQIEQRHDSVQLRTAILFWKLRRYAVIMRAWHRVAHYRARAAKLSEASALRVAHMSTRAWHDVVGQLAAKVSLVLEVKRARDLKHMLRAWRAEILVGRKDMILLAFFMEFWSKHVDEWCFERPSEIRESSLLSQGFDSFCTATRNANRRHTAETHCVKSMLWRFARLWALFAVLSVRRKKTYAEAGIFLRKMSLRKALRGLFASCRLCKEQSKRVEMAKGFRRECLGGLVLREWATSVAGAVRNSSLINRAISFYIRRHQLKMRRLVSYIFGFWKSRYRLSKRIVSILERANASTMISLCVSCLHAWHEQATASAWRRHEVAAAAAAAAALAAEVAAEHKKQRIHSRAESRDDESQMVSDYALSDIATQTPQRKRCESGVQRVDSSAQTPERGLRHYVESSDSLLHKKPHHAHYDAHHAKTDGAKTDGADGSKADGDGAKTDGAGGVKTDGGRTDGSKTDGTKTEGAKTPLQDRGLGHGPGHGLGHGFELGHGPGHGLGLRHGHGPGHSSIQSSHRPKSGLADSKNRGSRGRPSQVTVSVNASSMRGTSESLLERHSRTSKYHQDCAPLPESPRTYRARLNGKGPTSKNLIKSTDTTLGTSILKSRDPIQRYGTIGTGYIAVLDRRPQPVERFEASRGFPSNGPQTCNLGYEHSELSDESSDLGLHIAKGNNNKENQPNTWEMSPIKNRSKLYQTKGLLHQSSLAGMLSSSYSAGKTINATDDLDVTMGGSARTHAFNIRPAIAKSGIESILPFRAENVVITAPRRIQANVDHLHHRTKSPSRSVSHGFTPGTSATPQTQKRAPLPPGALNQNGDVEGTPLVGLQRTSFRAASPPRDPWYGDALSRSLTGISRVSGSWQGSRVQGSWQGSSFAILRPELSSHGGCE